MKIACLLVALMVMILSRCERKGDVEPNETDASFDEDLDTFVQKTANRGYLISGPGAEMTLVDVTNIKLLYANYKSSQKLQTAIKEFDRSSTALANKMLYLTVAMAFLAAVQVAKPIRRIIGSMREIIWSLAHSYMQRIAKTQKGTKPTAKQHEVRNELKNSSKKTPTQGN